MPCHLPGAPLDAHKLGTKCIRVERDVPIHQLGGVNYCAKKHRAELLTISSEEEFEQVMGSIDGSDDVRYWVDADDRSEEGIIKWKDGKCFVYGFSYNITRHISVILCLEQKSWSPLETFIIKTFKLSYFYVSILAFYNVLRLAGNNSEQSFLVHRLVASRIPL